jgi:hypothetical protein
LDHSTTENEVAMAVSWSCFAWQIHRLAYLLYHNSRSLAPVVCLCGFQLVSILALTTANVLRNTCTAAVAAAVPPHAASNCSPALAGEREQSC